uniref:Bardet-Biedl syndrome 1 N-terminal domain-containing protein n=1 Tax=Phasianus colchicus TaxID=9054 RepID=A0A669R047_PHACC
GVAPPSAGATFLVPSPSFSSSLWLAAHDDVMSGLRTFSTCMGERGARREKLVLGIPFGAGGGPELAVLSGSGPPRRHPLPEAPSALEVFYGGGAPPPPALLVVAAGGALYVYRNLRPFYKCALPPPGPPHEVEAELWAQAAQVGGE